MSICDALGRGRVIQFRPKKYLNMKFKIAYTCGGSQPVFITDVEEIPLEFENTMDLNVSELELLRELVKDLVRDIV